MEVNLALGAVEVVALSKDLLTKSKKFDSRISVSARANQVGKSNYSVELLISNLTENRMKVFVELHQIESDAIFHEDFDEPGYVWLDSQTKTIIKVGQKIPIWGGSNTRFSVLITNEKGETYENTFTV